MSAVKNNKTIVFIPGILGSALINKETNHYFFGLKELLSLSQFSLSLPLEWIDETQTCDAFYPCGPVTTLGGLGVYGSLISRIKKQYSNFIFFDYDWRRELTETTQKFIRFLKDINTSHGDCTILSHSMGGLIAFSAINQNPSLAKSVLFAGVPFGADVGYAIDIHEGAKLGFNKNLLNAKAQFSFPSTYTFFPQNESHVVDTHGTPFKFNWFNPEDWARYRFSMFQFNEINFQNTMQYLVTALQKASLFRQTLIPSKSLLQSSLKLAVLRSSAQQTSNQLVFDPENHQWDFTKGRRVDGDGRVTYDNAVVPSPLSYRDFKTTKSHAWLYTDLNKVKEALEYLLDYN